MVTEQWVVEEVLKVVPDAIVEAKDLHGSGDHFHVRVISESYEAVSYTHLTLPTKRIV